MINLVLKRYFPDKFFCLILLIFICIKADAQMHLKLNLQNMHLWRGMEVASGGVLTTDLAVSNKKETFFVGLWGGVNMNGSYKEFNYYLSYKFSRFKIELWDIYNFSPGASYNNKEFFNYKAPKTGRFIDATLSYTISEKFPLYLSWSTILFGRDRDELNIHNRYSTFVYAEYPVWRNDKWEVKPGLGASFALSRNKDLNGIHDSHHFYGTKASIMHISLTTIYQLCILKKEFPITVLALWNPQKNEAYLQVGINLISF